jgi:hypothetical protein
MSLDYSIQCNTRSGRPSGGEGEGDIDRCLGNRKSWTYNKRKRKRNRERRRQRNQDFTKKNQENKEIVSQTEPFRS